MDEEDTSRLRLKFPPSPRSGAYPVQMSDVAMSFDGHSDHRRRGASLQSFWWREEGRKERGRIQGDFCVHLLFICAAIQLIRCCVCDWVAGLSRILGGG